MTYGWAILVVVAVVAALYGLGVFNIGAGAVTCSPCFSYFAYVDYSAGDLALRNGPQQLTSITAILPTGLTITPNANVDPGADITISGISTTGDVDFIIEYVVEISGFAHNDTATIRQ